MQKFIKLDLKSNFILAAEKRASKKHLDKDILVNAIIAYHDYLYKAGYILVYEGRRRKINEPRKRGTKTLGNTQAVQQVGKDERSGPGPTTGTQPGYASVPVA